MCRNISSFIFVRRLAYSSLATYQILFRSEHSYRRYRKNRVVLFPRRWCILQLKFILYYGIKIFNWTLSDALHFKHLALHAIRFYPILKHRISSLLASLAIAGRRSQVRRQWRRSASSDFRSTVVIEYK